MGVQSSTYQKTSQKSPISGQIWSKTHVVAHNAGKKGRNPKFFFSPRTVTSLAWWWAQKNLDFGHSSQSYKPLKFRQKVALCGGFCQMSTLWGFFRHFSLLVREMKEQNKIVPNFLRYYQYDTWLMIVNNSWLQPIVNKLTVWRKQKLCMVSLSLCCQQPGGGGGGDKKLWGECIDCCWEQTLNMRTFFFADITSRLFLGWKN